MNDLQPLNQNWLFGFVRQNASRVNTQVGTTRSASGRSASPNIAGNGHTPPEKPAPALTEPTATTSMRASCAWKGLSAQRCTATSCASKGFALARHVGEELLSGFVYAILLKSAIHRHNLDPNRSEEHT